MQSLDPRVNRIIKENMPAGSNYEVNECWDTYEVFQQPKTGESFNHVGSVHAPDEELALMFAKEQYGRRSHTANMWVVKSSNIFAFSPEESEMFDTTPDKLYREPAEYNKVREKIISWQERKNK